MSQTKIYKDSGIKFIVHSVSMEYLNPSYLDDILKVETKVINLKKASIEFEQRIYRKYDNQNIDIIKSKCKIVAIDKDSKITPIPNIILQSITERQ